MKTAIEKRLRRQVSGRLRDYFIASSIGYEEACLAELKAILPQAEIAAPVNGGIELKGKLVDCYQANLHLRTANRILMRVIEFPVSNFHQLEYRVKEIPWELFLPPGIQPLIRVQTVHSRLYHKTAIGDRIRTSIEDVFNRLGFSPIKPLPDHCPQTVFARLVNDRLTLSIDSSGELLYKRGVKTQGGNAPLRETTAAYALGLAGYNGLVPLIDPMCGSGTFSLEGAMIASRTPSGYLRKFSFMDWPSFNIKQWEYLLQQAQKTIRQTNEQLIFASDINPQVCQRLKHVVEQQSQWSKTIQVQPLDFFQFSPSIMTDQTGIVAINPPFGLRIGDEKNALKLFEKIVEHLIQYYKGWKCILIAPAFSAISCISFNWKKQTIVHGGKKRYLIIGEIK